MMRFRMMLAMEEPRVLVAGAMPIDLAAWGLREGEPLPVDPNRWAEERQYLRHDWTPPSRPSEGAGPTRWPS